MKKPPRTCKLCGLSFTSTEKAVWCKWHNCQETKQREPTEKQRQIYYSEDQDRKPFDPREKS